MAQSPGEQIKPLAPNISSSPQFNNQEHQIQGTISEQKIIRIKKFVTWCGCVTALLLIFVVIIIVLAFTVYNVKEPKVKMNGITLLNGTFTKDAPYNITLVADVSVKNTNYFTFRFVNSTTKVYYDGTGIGEGTTPPGKAKARRTKRFNVSMAIMANKLMDIPSLRNDVSDLAVTFSTYTRIDGKVKVLNLFKRKVVVELNCTTEYNTTTGVIDGNDCLTRVDI